MRWLAALVLLLAGAGCGDLARPDGGDAGSPVVAGSGADAAGAAGTAGGGDGGAEAGQPLGPGTPVSDVSFEVRTNATIGRISALLEDPDAVDWEAVRAEFSATPDPVDGATPPSLEAVIEGAASGPLGESYVEHFGSSDWLLSRALEAIEGSGEAATLRDPARAAALANLLTIELPLVRGLIAAEAGERLTEEGDLDPALGAPHQWVRLWVILHGSPPITAALTAESEEAIRSGATAAAAGDRGAVADAHDVVRLAVLEMSLGAIGTSEEDEGSVAIAYLGAVEPVLANLDRDAAARLRATLESEEPDLELVRALVAQLAERAGLEVSVARRGG